MENSCRTNWRSKTRGRLLTSRHGWSEGNGRERDGMIDRWVLLLTAWVGLVFTGCGTTAQRVAMEQLLVSDAVDQAVGQIDFSPLRGRDVFLDPEYVRTVRPLGFVNSDYVLSTLRHQIVASGCHLKDRREDAEVIIEPRVGSLGTDDYNIVYGLPRSEASAIAGAAMNTGISLPAVPEIAVGKSEYRQGFAKLTVFAYRADDRTVVWQSGVAKSTATSRDTWVMGAGPFQKGTIYRDKKLGGYSRLANVWGSSIPVTPTPSYLVARDYPSNLQAEQAVGESAVASDRASGGPATATAAPSPEAANLAANGAPGSPVSGSGNAGQAGLIELVPMPPPQAAVPVPGARTATPLMPLEMGQPQRR